MRKTFLQFTLLLLSLSSSIIQAKPLDHWTLQQQLNLPDWLTIKVSHRTRYEAYTKPFKKGTDTGGDQALAFRTQLFIGTHYKQFSLGTEFMDSRISLTGSNSKYTTGLINQTDLLQAYIAWQEKNAFGTGLHVHAKAGRQTLDFGSRRLIARNRYRNTINNFSGLDISISKEKKWQWRNFIMFPVSRLPSDQASLKNNIAQFDQENFERIFAGSFFSLNTLAYNTQGEAYLYYLDEHDTKATPTKNRQLVTYGVRWRRPAKISQFDFEFESVLQQGYAFASKSNSDTTRLNHFAHFSHIEVGYSFDAPWQPRLILQYDYASGDKDPNDNQSNRFETLFGARRFDFGPTSIWGPFARANISTPGLRLKLKPTKTISAFLSHRAYWLAQAKDSWTGAKITDKTGLNGDYLGQQLELRIRWNLVPKHIRLESGWAHLFKGGFAKNTLEAPSDTSDSDYFYFQTSFHL